MLADLRPGVTVVIPTIPPRAAMLERAVASAAAQTAHASIIVEEDPGRTGSAATRNRALAKVETEWVLFLDDDDQLLPWSVQVLAEAQRETGADVVSGGAWLPEKVGHQEPGPYVPAGWLDAGFVTWQSVLHVTSLVRTSLARRAGGFAFLRDVRSGMVLDDYGFYCALSTAGAKFWRVPETILIWHIHGKNTSGRGDRWLALVEPKLLGERDQAGQRIRLS